MLSFYFILYGGFRDELDLDRIGMVLGWSGSKIWKLEILVFGEKVFWLSLGDFRDLLSPTH